MPQSPPSLRDDSRPPHEIGAFASHPTSGKIIDPLYCEMANAESSQTDSLDSETGVDSKGVYSGQEISTSQQVMAERRYLCDWVSEIVAVIASAGVAATIPIVLCIYNHRPIPQLNGTISINTIIAVLSTVAKSSLLYALSAALGQAKWDWYCLAQKSNRLNDMEIFDQASRGPFGAARFLLRRRTAMSPAAVGALVVVLCLVVDPFTQQVVGWSERQVLVPSEEVWTPKAAIPYFCSSYYGAGGRLDECQSKSVDAINAGIWTEPELYQPHTHCPTGECEWEPFETIELCLDHQVIEPSTANCDISFNKTRFNEGYKTYNASSETYVGPVWSKSCDLFPGVWNFTSYEVIDYWGTESRSNFPGYRGATVVQSGLRRDYQNSWSASGPLMPYMLVRFPAEIITSLPLPIGGDASSWDNSPQGVPYADVNNRSNVHIPSPQLVLAHTRFETFREGAFTRVPQELRPAITEWTVLSVCKARKQITVRKGVIHTSILSSTHLQAQTPVSSATGNSKCWGPPGLDLGDPSMAWLSEALPEDESSPYRVDPSTGAFCIFGQLSVPTYDITQRLNFVLRWTLRYNSTGHTDEYLLRDGWEQDIGAGSFYPVETTDIPEHISKRGLGSVMTSIVSGLNNLTLATSDDRATGSYVVRERILDVRWPWLAPLFLMELLGMGYLLVMIFRPRPVTIGGVWKDSILPVLYHGLDDGAQFFQTLESGSLKDMRKVARSVEAHLERSEGANGRVVLVQDNGDGVVRSRRAREENA
ncbi:hypothetical protein B0T20DRAFT_224314 [Sordaria brevicollis]|uniref:Uncharacterized protein n=1 Tax=Sordaria brevicollis TaxID=83679 RepID=A0AAE0UBN9_SORBR|nr:hypothetical protein B0T20DRAFT_224314 [Sordaria brevicollis]